MVFIYVTEILLLKYDGFGKIHILKIGNHIQETSTYCSLIFLLKTIYTHVGGAWKLALEPGVGWWKATYNQVLQCKLDF